MVVIFIATLVVQEGQGAEFERLQTELSELTHKHEPDTVVYDVLRHQEQANSYVVYARFKNQEAFELHQGTDFHKRLVPPILETLGAEMQLNFYEFVA
jgi:quinol monooxygenase YgiN